MSCIVDTTNFLRRKISLSQCFFQTDFSWVRLNGSGWDMGSGWIENFSLLNILMTFFKPLSLCLCVIKIAMIFLGGHNLT